MSLLRSVIRSRFGHRLSDSISSRPSFQCLNDSRKCFSTERQQHPEGPVYARLSPFTRRTLKTDVLTLLDGCNLTPNDVKFSYQTRVGFAPFGTFVQFPSKASYENAVRVIARKGKMYKLERVVRNLWDSVSPYDGKTVLLHHIPWNAVIDDIDRFLSGCEYDPTISFVTSPGIPDPIRTAVVHFPSQIEAMNAFITKNRNFCLNSQIMMQVLQ